MSGRKSRSKGQRAERKVAKLLTAWWGSEFHRTPGSGSFATRTSTDYNVSGDVSTPDETFPFCVEVKNQEGWHLEQLLTAPECDIIQWWRQAEEQCPEDRTPLLVFTRNHQPLFCVTTCEDWVPKEWQTVWIDGEPVRLSLFEDFLSLEKELFDD